MLDTEKKTVLNILRGLTGQDDVYKVVEADEILELLPADTVMNKQQLSTVIRDLRDREYLKVKYFTPDEYCLLTIKRTEELAQMVEEVTAFAAKEKTAYEQASDERGDAQPDGREANSSSKPRRETVNVKINKLSVMLFAFLGGLIGGAVVAALAVILQKFAV